MNTATVKCAQLFHEYGVCCISALEREAKPLIKRAQSGIEALFFAGFACEVISHDLKVHYSWSSEPRFVNGYEASICAQGTVGPYTADFLLSFYNGECNVWLTIAIECDGHDFHEKTKQQARHDKRRDRYFQINNISVLRFTGSEIWKDARQCARDVFALYNSKSKSEAA